MSDVIIKCVLFLYVPCSNSIGDSNICAFLNLCLEFISMKPRIYFHETSTYHKVGSDSKQIELYKKV